MSEAKMSGNSLSEDPCAGFGREQKAAFVWFFAVMCIGALLCVKLAGLDFFLYSSNAEFFDYDAYRDNRHAQVGIPSDKYDERAHGDLVNAQIK